MGSQVIPRECLMGLAEFCGVGDLAGPKCTCYVIEQNSLFLEQSFILKPHLGTPFPHPPFLCPTIQICYPQIPSHPRSLRVE